VDLYRLDTLLFASGSYRASHRMPTGRFFQSEQLFYLLSATPADAIRRPRPAQRPFGNIVQHPLELSAERGVDHRRSGPQLVAEKGAATVAMVNDTFARRFLNGEDPRHKHLVMEKIIPWEGQNGPAVAWHIVGVFHTEKSRRAREDVPETETRSRQEAPPIAGAVIAVNA